MASEDERPYGEKDHVEKNHCPQLAVRGKTLGVQGGHLAAQLRGQLNAASWGKLHNNNVLSVGSSSPREYY